MLISIPLKQHVGHPDHPIVKVGDAVKRGQLIAVPTNMGANIFSSLSGLVTKIDENEIVIECSNEQDLEHFVPLQDADSLLDMVEEAGIVGAGGAGFPTAMKLKNQIPNGIFIANAVECETLLAHNMEEIDEELELLIKGIHYCLSITKAPCAVIAIKEKHNQEIALLKEAIKDDDKIELFLLPDLYPAGDERVLVREIKGITLEPGQLPIEADVIVDNIETIKRIAEAIDWRKPFIDKDVTVAGRVKDGSIVLRDVPIGVPVSELIRVAGGYEDPHGEIIIGGPMTGSTGNEQTPVTKVTGGVLVAMPFPKIDKKMGLLVCECGGSEERMRHIADEMGATVVAVERCKRMVEVNGRYRCSLPGVCPGQAEAVLSLRKKGAESLMVGTCSN